MSKLNVALSTTPEKEKVVDAAPMSNKEELNKFIEEETKLVKGRFRNYDYPGASARIQIRKYPGIPMFDKWMVDEGTYEIPLYVARHLNGIDATATHINGETHTCSYPVHGFKHEGNNLPLGEETIGAFGATVSPREHVTKRIRRYGFETLLV